MAKGTMEVQVRVNVWMKLRRKVMRIQIQNGNSEEGGFDNWLNLLKEALENSETSAVDFVEDFKMNLYLKKSMFYT
jgi:GTP pyrophosphokinase